MLKDLKREDWLQILDLPEHRIPATLILRGTRNLRRHYTGYRSLFENVIQIGSANGLFEDIFVGERHGRDVGYSSVYGPAMASEISHLFSVMGTKLIIQTGVCGGLADGVEAGDIVIPRTAGCGDGASQCYLPGIAVVRATESVVNQLVDLQGTGVPVHTGAIWTTSALLAESDADIDGWHDQGYAAVDMETATTFAVAEYYGVERVSILSVFDNPRHGAHLGMEEFEKDSARALGEAAALSLVLHLVETSV